MFDPDDADESAFMAGRQWERARVVAWLRIYAHEFERADEIDAVLWVAECVNAGNHATDDAKEGA
jgi:hypothetical protein